MKLWQSILNESFPLTEALTKADFDKLRQDAGAFTKNVRRIKSAQELAVVAQAWSVWVKHVDTTIYSRLAGVNSTTARDNEGPSMAHVREKFWALTAGLKRIFVGDLGTSRWSSRYINSDDLLNGAREFAYTKNTAWAWDELYRDFDRKRDSVYAKLSATVRDAFRALDALQGDSHTDHFITDKLSVDGIPVTIWSSEIERDNKVDGRAMVRTIERVVKLIRQRGLGHVLDKANLRFVVNRTQYDFDSAAGTYSSGGQIEINAFDDYSHYIVAHEVGHHFFKLMSRERQTAWDRFIKRNELAFDDEDFKLLRHAFDAAFRARRDHRDNTGYVVDGFWQTHVPSYLPFGATKTKYRHFMMSHLGTRMEKDRLVLSPLKSGEGLEHTWTEFKKEATGPFMLFAPTAYANKNTEEAFCEVFANYVIGTPLADIVRYTFREVVGLD